MKIIPGVHYWECIDTLWKQYQNTHLWQLLEVLLKVCKVEMTVFIQVAWWKRQWSALFQYCSTITKSHALWLAGLTHPPDWAARWCKFDRAAAEHRDWCAGEEDEGWSHSPPGNPSEPSRLWSSPGHTQTRSYSDGNTCMHKMMTWFSVMQVIFTAYYTWHLANWGSMLFTSTCHNH